MRLTSRLLLLTLIVLIPPILIEAYTALDLRRERQEEVHALALRQAELASSELDHMLDGVKSTLTAAGAVDSVRMFDTPRCVDYLATLKPRVPQLAFIAAIDATGVMRCRDVPPDERLSFADRPYFREAMAGTAFVVGEYVVSRVNEQPTLPVAMPLRDRGGAIVGVVTAALDLSWLSDRLRERGVPPGGSVTIADRNGIIIARLPNPENFVGTPIAAEFMPLVSAPEPGSVEMTSRDGTRRVLGYLPATGNPLGLYIAAGLSADFAYAAVDAVSLRGAVLIGLSLFAALAAALLAGGLFIRRPVAGLLATVAAWRGGDLSARTGMTADKGEFGMLGAEFDRMVGEVQRREEALRESETRLRLAVEATGIGIWDVDARTGRRRWSAEFRQILGLTPDAEDSAELFTSVIHPDDRDWVNRLYAEAYRSKHGGRYEAEFRIRRPSDGAERWVITTGRISFDAEGRPIRGVGTLRDITDRKLYETALQESRASLQTLADTLEQRVGERTEELAEANRRLMAQIEERERIEATLRQMQRLEAVGQLTSGIAHDFNNLLTVILGNVDSLERSAEDPRQQRRLAMMRTAAERGAKLTGQLLAFSRRQRLDPRPLDLNAVVSGMRDLLHGTLGGSVRLEIALAPDLRPALADQTQVELVILNLAINARDAMEVGGTLTVTTANRTVTEPPRRPENPPLGEHVVIAIADTGTGMSEQVLAKAFEPFFTTKEVGKGSGLGLAQVFGFAKQSGGGVAITSREGEGTTVEVFLPASGTLPAAPEERAEAPSPRRGDGRTVLVVDDDASVREVTVALLAERGFAVVEAAGGAEALERLKDGTAVDIALIDFAMPGMNGADFAREAARLKPGLPFVFVTGFADLKALADYGEQQIVEKPIRTEELFRKIDLALAPA